MDLWLDKGQTVKRLWPHERESKQQHSSSAIPNKKIGILLLIVITGVVLVVTTIIVERNSGFLQSLLGGDQVRSTTTPTVSPESGISLPAPRATIALPEISPSPTYTPTATPVTPTLGPPPSPQSTPPTQGA